MERIALFAAVMFSVAAGTLPFLHSDADIGPDHEVLLEKTEHHHVAVPSSSGDLCQCADPHEHPMVCIACQWGQTNNARSSSHAVQPLPNKSTSFSAREPERFRDLLQNTLASPRAPPLFS